MDDESHSFQESSSKESSDNVAWLLDHVNTLQRSPKGLGEAWDAAQRAEENTTGKIFLNRGKFAWVADHLGKLAAEKLSLAVESDREMVDAIRGLARSGRNRRRPRWLDDFETD